MVHISFHLINSIFPFRGLTFLAKTTVAKLGAAALCAGLVGITLRLGGCPVTGALAAIAAMRGALTTEPVFGTAADFTQSGGAAFGGRRLVVAGALASVATMLRRSAAESVLGAAAHFTQLGLAALLSLCKGDEEEKKK